MATSSEDICGGASSPSEAPPPKQKRRKKRGRRRSKSESCHSRALSLAPSPDLQVSLPSPVARGNAAASADVCLQLRELVELWCKDAPLDALTILAANGILLLRDLAYGYDEADLADELSWLVPAHCRAVQACDRACEKGVIERSSAQPAASASRVMPSVVVPLPTVVDANAAGRSMEAAAALTHVFMLVGAGSTLWSSYVGLPTLALRRSWLKMLQDELADYDYRGLQQAMSTWRLWVSFCKANSCDELRFDVVRTGLFLSEARASGPTAAHGRFGRLRFLELHLGIPFGTSAKMVKCSARVRNHAPAVWDALMPRDVLTLCFWAQSKNEHLSYFCSSVLLMVVGCIRFRHQKRSKLDGQDDGADALLFTCSQGKSRVNGAPAPPFEWVVPCGWLREYWSRWIDVRKRLLPPDVSIMLPALRFDSQDDLVFGGCAFVGRAMAEGQFNRVLAKVLAVAPTPEWSQRPTTLAVGARAVRRTLPTIARCLDVSKEDALAIGNWCEKSGGMPLLYTSGRRQLSINVKLRCMRGMQSAVCSARESKSWRPSDRSNESWAELLADLGDPFSSSAPAAAAVTVKSDHQPEARTDGGNSSSSSSSDEASAASAPSDDDGSTLLWCSTAAGTLHRRHACASRPECSLAAVTSAGVGLASAHSAVPSRRWCKRCALDLSLVYSTV